MRGWQSSLLALVALLLFYSQRISALSNSGVYADPNFFPISVWLQGPQNAPKFQQAGVNVYVDAEPYFPITQPMLTALKAAGIYLIGTVNAVGISSPDTNVVIGWFAFDEPDDAQEINSTHYGPCIDPSVIVAEYKSIHARDPRPVLLNLGMGVADVNWGGRGVCTGKTNMYPEYVKGADWVGFDIYPRNAGYPLEIIATGVDNLRKWSNYSKPVSTYIETTKFQSTSKEAPSFRDIKAEVWMALTHGVVGISYFCHVLSPTFVEDGCVANATIASWLKQINGQIKVLAPVLNSPTINGAVSVSSNIPVDIIVKVYQQHTYIFGVAMRDSGVTATFTLKGVSNAVVTVIDENRTISLSNGSFMDNFTGYGVHLYEVSAVVTSAL